MSMSNTTKFARREFLGKVAATVTGTATLALSSSLVQATPVSEAKVEQRENNKSKGYQRTEHVDTYYHLADF